MSAPKSNIYKNSRPLSGLDINTVERQDLVQQFWDILNRKIHGIAFSAVMEGQTNKSNISKSQVKERLNIITPYTRWIRTFSCTTGNENVPAIAARSGLKTMVGVWLDDDLENNEVELSNGIDIVKAGHADILAIGNEVLLREEMSEDDLISYIRRAKDQAGDVPVGYVDAYFKFEDHPRVAEACDVLLVNCYPFWEEYSLQHAHVYMKDMYRRAQIAAKGKDVIIAETGWPTQGAPYGEAVPSSDATLKYFIDAYNWADAEGIDIFYFAAFDETWKVDKEGDVGAYWGLWDKDGKPKYV